MVEGGTPLRKSLSFLCCVLLCLLTLPAVGQNYIYTFYDGPNATGNVMATYVGPLLTSDYISPPPLSTSGFTLNPSALLWQGYVPPITATSQALRS